jgi:serine kinase of HPr protein (carbohydrate metabolism regulator)
VLILGQPGAGKSTLLAGLLAAGAYLVADDLVRLTRRGSVLIASAVDRAGLIELRGGGIFRVATTTGGVPVNLCVELESPDGHERLPERRTMTIEGVELACLRLAAPGHAAAVAGVLVALAARRVA